jgi:hypothetical protein
MIKLLEEMLRVCVKTVQGEEVRNRKGESEWSLAKFLF